MSHVDFGKLLLDVSAEEAQLVLSYVVWPEAAPLPRAVDEWVRGHPADELSSPRRRRAPRSAVPQTCP